MNHLTVSEFRALPLKIKKELLLSVMSDFAERYEIAYILGDIDKVKVLEDYRTNETQYINVGTYSFDRSYAISRDMQVVFIG